jgi:hypothetical protein
METLYYDPSLAGAITMSMLATLGSLGTVDFEAKNNYTTESDHDA